MTTEKLTAREKRAQKRRDAVQKASVFLGINKDNEPVINPLDYTLSLMKAMNSYNVSFDNKTKKKWFLSYVGKKDAALYDDLEDWRFTTLGVLARLKQRNQPLNEQELNTFGQKVEELKKVIEARKKQALEKKKTATPEKVVPVKSKSEELLSTCVAEFNGMIDEFITDDKEPDFATYLKSNNIPGAVAKGIPKHFSSSLEEVRLAIEGEDRQLVEGYSNFKKTKLKKLLKVYQSIFDACDQQVVTAKAPRKTRVKKEKPASVLASKVKYLKESVELNVKSELPVKIVGSSEVWIYNIKYRKLNVYRATNDQKLSIKGTTLINYEVSKSSSKTIRKPETLSSLVGMTKRNIQNYFETLTTKESTINGRINEECIILKVFP